VPDVHGRDRLVRHRGVVYGASIAELATKIGQIMVTDTEIAAKTPFAEITLTGGVLAEEALALFK